MTSALMAMVSIAALSGLAWWLRPRANAPPSAATWVATREGLVRFGSDAVALIPWTAIRAVERTDAGIRIRVGEGAAVEVHPLIAGGAWIPPAEIWLAPTELGGLEPLVFVDRLRGAIADPAVARRLPGFRDPEGPPEAVLAGLPDPPRGTLPPEERMAFASDLTTLMAPLDPVAHAEEIGKLRACRTVPDLERLASADGGWLTSRRTDPRLKLVRHGTGTFLVVRYDDGWSSTVSQAPFRTR